MKDNKQIQIFKATDNQTGISVFLDGETVWLSQDQMVELFHTTKQNISLHINNIYKEKELESISTIKESLTVRNEGARSNNRKIDNGNSKATSGKRIKQK